VISNTGTGHPNLLSKRRKRKMALLAAKDNAGIPRSLILDDITRTLVAIDQEHHEAHEGDMYHAQVSQEVTDTGNLTVLAFSTPLAGGKRVHLVVGGNANDAVQFKLIETPSIDEAEHTSLIVPFNKDRDSLNTSGLFDTEPVKATNGVLEWTGVSQELDSFSIGLDVYLITALEATATAANPAAVWLDMSDPSAAAMDGIAITAIDAHQATSLNDQTVEASQGAGTTIDLNADGFGENGNLAVTIIVGANMAAGVSLTGGVGAPNDGKDSEIHGTLNAISYFDLTDSAGANITTTVALLDELMGSSTNPNNAQSGQSRGNREFILAAGTQYCLLMEALNANTMIHTLTMDWYEHTHKDPTFSF
jgi:hypothetical protein